MTGKTTIRVGVGTPETMQSSIWRFWNDAEELYVVARESRMAYKLSLHSSGIARLAYLKERDIRDPLIMDSDPRVIYRWRQPDTFINGWMRRLDVVVPAVPVTKYFSLDAIGEPKGAIQWLKPLKRGDRYQITLLVADSQSRNPDDIRLQGDEIIGSLPLPSGRAAWIRTRREKMSKAEMERSETFANDMKINYDSDPGEVFAALIMVDKDSSHPVITNLALGWEHITVKGSRDTTIA
jgi:hypothetical protein